MTRTELIAKLEAAPKGTKELDRLIAREYGWHRVEPRHLRNGHGGWIEPGEFNGTMSDGSPILDGTHGTTIHRDPPMFTASLDAAFTLVPEGWHIYEMAQKDPSLKHFLDRVKIAPHNTNDDAWATYSTGAAAANAATLPLAICIAALRARALIPSPPSAPVEDGK